MKATVYIFGNFAEGYSQYPDDYSHDILGSVSKSRQGATELVYHRDGSLVYYIYTREISHSANTYIGLCYVFNGVLVKDLSFLFNIFEDTVTNIVVKGDLLEFTDDGGLSTQVRQLYSYTEELQRVSDYLNSKLTSLGGYAEKLPPPNYAVSGTEWKTLSFDEIADVRNALRDYSNIRVVKGENYDTDSMRSYAYKLKNQNDEIIRLTKELSERGKRDNATQVAYDKRNTESEEVSSKKRDTDNARNIIITVIAITIIVISLSLGLFLILYN